MGCLLTVEKKGENHRDHPEGLAPPEHLAGGHGCKPWWLKHPNDPISISGKRYPFPINMIAWSDPRGA